MATANRSLQSFERFCAMKQKKRPFPFTKQARREKRRACFLRNAECSRTIKKNYTPRFDGARIWQKIRAVERAARVRRTWYGSRAEREESQTTVPFPLQKCVNCQSCFRERESCMERKITPRGLTAPGFFQPKKVKAPFVCLKTLLRSESI